MDKNCDLDMKKAKILITDDEVRFCESIRVFLNMQGFDVEIAHSVEESVSLTANNRFDIFLVDKQMPGDDGFVFMDYAIANYPDVPFIMMTGRASVDSAVLALKKGAYDYLKKPFKYEELVNTVNNALEKKRLKEENRKITSMFKAAQQKYKDIIHNSPDLFFMLDRNMCLTFVNKTFESILNYSFESVKGRPLTDFVYEKDHEKLYFFLHDRRSKKSRRAGLGTEIRMKYRSDNPDDCDLIDLEIKKSSFAFCNDEKKTDPQACELCIVGRDISYRKQFEKQLIYSQKMEAVGVLAGGIAHNFNNLLMNIQGQATIIKMEIDPDHPCYEKFNIIERHINRGANIAKQLLNFARGGDYNVKPINMNHAIKDTLELFSLSGKNIKIRLELDENLWLVAVDICQMEQVFLNLFMNSHHAMPKGGELFIKSENVVLDRKEADKLNCVSGKYIKLTVKDTGCGIAKNIQKKIFDPFFTTKNQNQGTGLGLASAYGIIKKHHGKIFVESEPDQGAMFIIYLYADNNKIEVSSDAMQNQHGGALKTYHADEDKSTIIVIDDDTELLEQSSNMLKAMGFKVITAENGRDGIQKYLKDYDSISLVLLDMVMPGLNGAETFEYIKKINPESRVLISTGYRKTDDIDLILKDKTSAFLKKPYGIEQLSEKISMLLTRENHGESSS